MKNLLITVVSLIVKFLFKFESPSNFISSVCWGAYLAKRNPAWVEILVRMYHAKYKLVNSKLIIASEKEAIEAFSIMKNNGVSLNNHTMISSDNVKMVDGMIIAPAMTSPTTDGEVFIMVTPSLLAEQIINEYSKYKHDIKNGWNSVRFVMLHEIWHSNQMHYIMQTGGVSMLHRVMKKELESQYSEGLLEVGANEYASSDRKTKQDLKVFLAA